VRRATKMAEDDLNWIRPEAWLAETTIAGSPVVVCALHIGTKWRGLVFNDLGEVVGNADSCTRGPAVGGARVDAAEKLKRKCKA
jgi:hypothetical protein